MYMLLGIKDDCVFLDEIILFERSPASILCHLCLRVTILMVGRTGSPNKGVYLNSDQVKS